MCILAPFFTCPTCYKLLLLNQVGIAIYKLNISTGVIKYYSKNFIFVKKIMNKLNKNITHNPKNVHKIDIYICMYKILVGVEKFC